MEVIKIIRFRPFWETMKAKGISTYKLEKDYGISKSMIFKLKHDKNIQLLTLNDLCKMFDCTIADIIEYIPDDEENKE